MAHWQPLKPANQTHLRGRQLEAKELYAVTENRLIFLIALAIGAWFYTHGPTELERAHNLVRAAERLPDRPREPTLETVRQDLEHLLKERLR